jgi:hypothetical protein
MDILPATVEQLAVFKQAAADRYQALGIPADKADMLFERKLASLAGALGMPTTMDLRAQAVAEKIASAVLKIRSAGK